MKVSVVVPVFNEAANLEDFLRRLLAVLDRRGEPYEVILVDDGSRDRSLEILKSWAERRADRVRALELSRNFGQHQAILAGFRDVTGDAVVTLDADLQNPPEEIPKLLEKFEEGFDVVGGVRRQRQDSWPRRLASALVNRMTVAITRMRLTDFGCMLRAYSRDVVDEINRCDEASTFIPALAQSFARRPTEIEVAHAPRGGGESAYSFYRLIRLNFDLMTGFSSVPIQLFGLLGSVVALGGIAFGVFLFVRRLIVGAEVEGVFTLFAILFTLLGIAMAGLGIVGEYVGRIYEQVRGRPRFSVRRAYGLGAEVESRESRSTTRISSMTRIAVFGYSDTGHACLKSLLERGEDVVLVATHADDPEEPRWFDSVADLARSHGIEPLDRGGRPRPGRAGEGPGRATRASLLLLLSRHPAAGDPGSAAPGGLQHPRLAPSRVPGARSGQLGRAARGEDDRSDAARDDREARRGGHRGPGGGPDRPRRHGDRGAEARHRGGREDPGAASGGFEERQGAAPPAEGIGRHDVRPARPRGRAIEWNRTAEDVHNLVRAVTHPYPGAFTDIFGGKTFLWKTRLPHLGAHDNFPGQIRTERGRLYVACEDDRYVEILRIQREGEEEMDAAAFISRMRAK